MIRVKPEPKRVTANRNAVTLDRNASAATVTPNRNAARQKAWRERQKDAKKALVDIWADFHETVSADG